MSTNIIYKIVAKCITAYYFFKVGAGLLLYFVTHPFAKLVKDRPTPPKCLTDPKYGEHHYAKVNGVKLHYVEKGDKSKPLIVFVHGFPEFWYSWRYQLLEFSKDFWCIAIDKRGYGDSEKPMEKHAYKMENVADDIKELVLSLGRKRFTLIGHDWGAVVAHRFVDTYASMLDNFITMSGPSGDVWIKLVFSEWWQFTHAWYVFFFQNPCLPETSLRLGDLAMFKGMAIKNSKGESNVTDEDVEAYKYTFGKPNATTPALNYYRDNFLDTYDAPESVDTRGLFIIGEKDDYVSRGCIDLLKKKYPNLKTITMRGARHFIQQENPEDVNRLIREFLKP